MHKQLRDDLFEYLEIRLHSSVSCCLSSWRWITQHCKTLHEEQGTAVPGLPVVGHGARVGDHLLYGRMRSNAATCSRLLDGLMPFPLFQLPPFPFLPNPISFPFSLPPSQKPNKGTGLVYTGPFFHWWHQVLGQLVPEGSKLPIVQKLLWDRLVCTYTPHAEPYIAVGV